MSLVEELLKKKIEIDAQKKQRFKDGNKARVSVKVIKDNIINSTGEDIAKAVEDSNLNIKQRIIS